LKLLAIDTATEQCSVALLIDAHCVERCVPTPRGHTELVLPMVQEVLSESGLSLQQLDAIAFGRGPGAFTGVRIAIGVAQGLAYALGVPVLPVSNLAAVAQQAAAQLNVGEQVLVCMDARMGEIYMGVFALAADGLMVAVGAEQLLPPGQLRLDTAQVRVGLGTGFRAYPLLREQCAALRLDDSALPRAREIAQLAARDHAAGLAVSPEQALPVYLRDQVVHVKAL
jgi:tRNA threonylcarbamoyladenosine biosynthesis protein TsaB